MEYRIFTDAKSEDIAEVMGRRNYTRSVIISTDYLRGGLIIEEVPVRKVEFLGRQYAQQMLVNPNYILNPKNILILRGEDNQDINSHNTRDELKSITLDFRSADHKAHLVLEHRETGGTTIQSEGYILEDIE